MAHELQIALAKHTRVISYSHAELTPGPDRSLHATMSRVMGACDFRPEQTAVGLQWLRKGSFAVKVAGPNGSAPLSTRWEVNVPFPRCTSSASADALALLMHSDPINVTPLGTLRQNFLVAVAFKYLRSDTKARLLKCAADAAAAQDNAMQGSTAGSTATSVPPSVAARVPELEALATALRHIIPPSLLNMAGEPAGPGDAQSAVMGILAKAAPAACFADAGLADVPPARFEAGSWTEEVQAGHAKIAPLMSWGKWNSDAEHNTYLAIACSVADMHSTLLSSVARPEIARALSASTPLVDLSMFHAGGEGGIGGGASDYQFLFGVHEAYADVTRVLSSAFPGRLQHSARRGDLDGVSWGVERGGAQEVADRYGLLWGPLLHQELQDSLPNAEHAEKGALQAPYSKLKLHPDGRVDKGQSSASESNNTSGVPVQGIAWPVVAPVSKAGTWFDRLQSMALESSTNAAGGVGMAQLTAVVANTPPLPVGYDPIPIGSVPILSPARAKQYAKTPSTRKQTGGTPPSNSAEAGTAARGSRLAVTGDSQESSVQHMISSATHGQERWHAHCMLEHIQEQWTALSNLCKVTLLNTVLQDLAEAADEFHGQSFAEFSLYDDDVNYEELDNASVNQIATAAAQAATLVTRATNYAVSERRRLAKHSPELAALDSESGVSDTDDGIVDVLWKVDSGRLALELASRTEGPGRLLNASAVGGWDCLPPYVGPPPTSEAHALELADVLNGVDLGGDDEGLEEGVMLLATHYNWLSTLKFAARNVRSDALDATTNKVSRDECPIKGVVLLDPRMPEFSPPPPPLDAEQRMVDALVHSASRPAASKAEQASVNVPDCGLMSSSTPVPGVVLPRSSHGKSLAGEIMNSVVPSPWSAVQDEFGLHTGRPVPADATKNTTGDKNKSGYGDGLSWLWRGPFGNSDPPSHSTGVGSEVTAPLATPTKVFAPGAQLTAHAILDEVLFRDALFGTHPRARLRLGLLRQYSDTFELTGLPGVTRSTWGRLSKSDPAVEGVFQGQACLAMEDYLIKAASAQGAPLQAVYSEGLAGGAAAAEPPPGEQRHTGGVVPLQPMMHAYTELEQEQPPLAVFADTWHRGQLQSKWADWCQSGEFSSGLVSLVSEVFRPETLPFPVTVLVTSQTPQDVQARPWAHWRMLCFPFTRHGVNTLSHYPAGSHVVQARKAMMADADQRLAVWNALYPGSTFRLATHPSLVREPWECDHTEAAGFVRKLMLGAVDKSQK